MSIVLKFVTPRSFERSFNEEEIKLPIINLLLNIFEIGSQDLIWVDRKYLETSGTHFRHIEESKVLSETTIYADIFAHHRKLKIRHSKYNSEGHLDTQLIIDFSTLENEPNTLLINLSQSIDPDDPEKRLTPEDINTIYEALIRSRVEKSQKADWTDAEAAALRKNFFTFNFQTSMVPAIQTTVQFRSLAPPSLG